jgi:IS1 family transposase
MVYSGRIRFWAVQASCAKGLCETALYSLAWSATRGISAEANLETVRACPACEKADGCQVRDRSTTAKSINEQQVSFRKRLARAHRRHVCQQRSQ